MATSRQSSTLPCLVIGASGYAGAELVRLINEHPVFSIAGLYVSESSLDKLKPFADLYPKFQGVIDQVLQPASIDTLNQHLVKLTEQAGRAFVFLATPHQFSHDIGLLLASDTVTVFDLSGAFRLKNSELYPEHYGFVHNHAENLSNIPYALSEWLPQNIHNASLISLPGCYPTASQLALKPVLAAGFADLTVKPVINAISGVSGAGRKANIATSYCELSLKPYNIFKHRHTPEIEQGLGTSVIFIPHVADFDRGILATISLRLKANIDNSDIDACFKDAYSESPLVRLVSAPPAINNVASTPYCDIYWQINGSDLIIISAIDNLLKGASSQAIEVANTILNLPIETGLIASASSTISSTPTSKGDA